MIFLNKIINFFSRDRITRIYNNHDDAKFCQKKTFDFLIENGEKTEWGKIHQYTKNMSYSDFKDKTPISKYEDIFPFIEKMLNFEENILWPGKVYFFAKSSGTTNDKSKYIPMTEDNIKECHLKGGKDAIFLHYEQKPESKIILGKSVGIGGSFDKNHQYNKNITIGDLSAILMKKTPFLIDNLRVPKLEIATLSSWEEKLEILASETIKEDVRLIAGVPSWSNLFLKKILEKSNKKSIFEVWPNLEAFFHGGVSIDPYKESFNDLFEEKIFYQEIYNASEGFFAIQDTSSKGMLLMLDYNIFYEFIPFDKINDKSFAIDITQVSLGVQYAMIITTSSGLWRYLIGDVIEFVSISPYRIKIVGRTSHFINIFGEELMVANTDSALAKVCSILKCKISEYSIAPNINKDNSSGFHEWVIEFIDQSKNLDDFVSLLDREIRLLNSDYNTKRTNDLLLKLPVIRVVKTGTFYRFMGERKKLGGQNKVPRLSHDRKYIESLIKISNFND